MNSLVILAITIIALCIALYVGGPLLITFHELGHAFAYLTLTKSNKVDIYIGSYEDKASKLNFKLGKLHFHINPAFSLKTKGSCSADAMADNYIKEIIILLAGSILTVILFCLLGFFVFNVEVHIAIKIYVFSLIISAFIGLVSNLVPGTIKGVNIYNDGKLISFTYRIRHVYADYVIAQQHILKGENAEAIIKLKAIIAKFPYEERLIHKLITILLLTKQFEEAKTHLLNLGTFTELTINDYINIGYIQILSKQNKEAETNFNNALRLNANHPIVLNNLGYVSILLEKYQEAEQYLEKAIKLQPECAEPYNNLGQLKLVNNQLEEGKMLIEKSIALNPENADAYKNLGIYYSKTAHTELKN